jgi:hypothetical protein
MKQQPCRKDDRKKSQDHPMTARSRVCQDRSPSEPDQSRCSADIAMPSMSLLTGFVRSLPLHSIGLEPGYVRIADEPGGIRTNGASQ